MAFIPDKAFEDVEEVGHKAFLLYSFYCKHGSMSKNVVWVSLESGARFLGIVYENVCRLSATLKKKGWIKQQNGKVVLIKGFEHLLKIDDRSNLPDQKTVKNNRFQLITDDFINSVKLKTDEISSQKLSKTTVAYNKEEPAHFNQKEKEKERFQHDRKSKTAFQVLAEKKWTLHARFSPMNDGRKPKRFLANSLTPTA
jgi:hypothetical protein